MDEVTDNTSDTTSCVLKEPVLARYVRIDFVQGQQDSNDRARIAEFELFSDASDHSLFEKENKSLTQLEGVKVEASSHHDTFVPENAVNGAISSTEEGWVSAPGSNGQWLKIDLGKERTFRKYVAYHIGKARTDLPHFNTKSYQVYVSSTDVENDYREVDSVVNNTEDMTVKIFEEPITARYIKLVFNEGQQSGAVSAQRARIAEFEVFEYAEDNSIFDVSDKQFSEHQDIANAELTTDMEIGGVPLSMNSWLSATENTMITQIASEGSKAVSLDVSAWTKDDGSANYKTDSGADETHVWASRSTYNAAKDNPESWTSEAVITTKIAGGKDAEKKVVSSAQSSLKFTLEPGEKICLVTTVGGGGQTYNHADELQKEEPIKEALALSDRLNNDSDIQNLQDAHQEWWKEYWLKSYINIGDEDYHRYYFGSLYYMGCTVRKDKVAPGLYGVWVTGDQAKYNNDYHLNYNYMAPGYGMFSSNRLDCGYAMTQPILDYMPKAAEASKNNLSDIKYDYVTSRPELANGIDGGVIYPVGLLPWGIISWNATQPGKYINQTLDAPFAATIFISYYNYTQDEEFLIQRAYPFVEKVAAFYEKWCEKEEKDDGSYQYNLYDGAHEGFWDKNAGVTIGAVQNVYEFLIQNYQILKEKAGVTEEQYNMWMDMYEHMAPVPIREYTVNNFSKEVFALSESGMILRPESASVELEFIHPGERLSFDSDPYQLEVAKNTVEAKEVANANVWSNMNNTPKMFTQAIRAGYDPAYVMNKFKESNINYMNENFTIRDGHHGVEKAGGIEFINNMLLQSSNGFIKVFPNWTGADAEFKTLREKGAYLVSASMTGQVVDYVDIISEAGKTVQLVSPWEGAKVTDENGNEVEVSYTKTSNSNEKVVVFSAEAGKIYHVEEGTPIVIPDKEKLGTLYQSALEKKPQEYTPLSWAEVEAAADNAKTVLDNEDATDDQINSAYEQLENALSALAARADLTALQALYDENYPKLEGENYTEESLAALESALNLAKTVLDKEANAQTQEADEALEQLKAAALGIEYKEITFVELSEKIKQCEAVETDKLTQASAAALAEAIEEAKKVTEMATREELWNAMDTLMQVVHELKYVANTEELKQLYQEVKEQESTWGDYTEDTVEALTDVLGRIETLLSRDDLTSDDQEEIDNLKIELESTADGLKLRSAEKNELQDIIFEAESKDYSLYTSNTVSKVSSKLKNAKQVMADDTLTIRDQDKVRQTADDLRQALDSLEKAADKSELQALISEAEKLQKETYTVESWSVLSDALDKARDLWNDSTIGESKQESINNAVLELNNAVRNLKKRPADPQPTPDEPDKNIQIEVHSGDNVPALNLPSQDVLLDAILNEAEKQAVSKGQNVKILFSVQPAIADDHVNNQIQQALQGSTLGAILEISIIKQLEGEEAVQIHQLETPLRFTLQIPDSLKASAGIQRTFVLYHITEEGIEVLNDLDNDPNTITAEVKTLSTFAVIYKDIRQQDTDKDNQSSDQQKEDSGEKAVEAAQTGDEAPIMPMLILIVLAALLIWTGYKVKGVKLH